MAKSSDRLKDDDIILYKDATMAMARHYYLGQYNMYAAYKEAADSFAQMEAPVLNEVERRIFQFGVRVLGRMVEATYRRLKADGHDVSGLPEVVLDPS